MMGWVQSQIRIVLQNIFRTLFQFTDQDFMLRDFSTSCRGKSSRRFHLVSIELILLISGKVLTAFTVAPVISYFL